MAITKIEVPELFDFGSDNSAFKLPTGTTAERPTSPSNGEMRFNTTTGYVEYYDTTDTQWWEIDYETVCTTNNPNYPITNLAYYKMSNASDSGEGSGYIGQGGIFNGTSSVISLGTSSPLNTFGGAQTISVWVKPSASRSAVIGYRNDSTLYWNLIEIMSNNTIRFLLRSGSGSALVFNSTGTITLNQWNHIAVTVDYTSAKIYINNGSPETASNIITSFSNTETTYIGYSLDVDATYFTGTIDQVRIYNTALSSSNVSLLYAETSTTSSTLDYPVTATALYEFSGNANDTGNTYNGTATNVEYAYNGAATNVNFNVQGKFGNAGEFNGSSSKITIPSISPKSISMWVNVSSTSGIDALMGHDSITSNFIYWNTGDLRVGSTIFTNFAKVANQWVHIALVESGSNIICYNNGTPIQTLSGSLGTYNLIGGRTAGTPQYTTGKIDQVRIFDSALNASQVTQLYNEIQCVPTIVPSENFNTVLYTGNDTNTSYTRDITGVGFDPDFVWIKDRDNSNFEHALFDSVRGAGASKILSSDSTGAEGWTTAAPMSAFITDGFSVQPRSPWNANNLVNKNGEDFVAWSWKAGGAAVSNTDGTVTSQVSANVDAGFSIVTNTSPTGAYTWGHGLSKAPELWIHKATNYTYGWETMYPDEFGQATGSNNPSDWNRIFLNTTAATTTNPFYSATDTVLSITGWGLVSNFVTYCFHSVDGFSKIGSYVGNGSTTGPIITLGFEPAWIMFKPTTATGYWYILDNKRSTTNPRNDGLFPNDSLNEITNTSYNVDFNSDGFQPKNNTIGFNQNGQTYIFMAFAADPT
mgnify:CR=1 FL=1